MADELLTVAEACGRLGVSERTLRRVLRAPELQAELQAVNRRIRGRDRQVMMVTPALLHRLGEQLSDANTPPKAPELTGGDEEAGQQATAGITPVRLALLYEQRLADKDALIEEQRARIADLQAALEHEREQSKRAQALLALTATEEQRIPFWLRWFSSGKRSNIT